MRLSYFLVIHLSITIADDTTWQCVKDGGANVHIEKEKIKVTESRNANVFCQYKAKVITDGKSAFCLLMSHHKARNMIGISSANAYVNSNHKGCYYNGGLGRNSVVNTFYKPFFGDYINFKQEISDNVCFAVDISETHLQMYIKHQLITLGLSYKSGQRGPLFPTVWFRGDGEVTFTNSESFDLISKERKKLKVGGTYDIKKLMESETEKPDLLKDCRNKKIIFQILNFGIAEATSDEINPNVFRVEFGKKENRHSGIIDKSKGSWETRDFSAEPENACYKFIHKLLKNINNLSCESENEIVVKGKSDNDFKTTLIGNRAEEPKYTPAMKSCD